MTGTDTRTKAARPPAARTIALAGVAALLALAAPALSFLPARTTNFHGSGAAASFPRRYPVILVATIVVTVVACALGGLLAGRAGLVAIPLALAWWAIIGLAVTIAGATLGHHAHLTDWGIAFVAAVAAGAAARRPATTTGTGPATLVRTDPAGRGGVAAWPHGTYVRECASTPDAPARRRDHSRGSGVPRKPDPARTPAGRPGG
jgi:hypothetical protein